MIMQLSQNLAQDEAIPGLQVVEHFGEMRHILDVLLPLPLFHAMAGDDTDETDSFGFAVAPRALGGYRLSCFEFGEEVAGGVFCTGDDLQDEADADSFGSAWLASRGDVAARVH
jgi:hypothetical protein